MKAPDKLYVLACTEWTGSKYVTENIGIYSTKDNAEMAAKSMQGITRHLILNIGLMRLNFVRCGNRM